MMTDRAITSDILSLCWGHSKCSLLAILNKQSLLTRYSYCSIGEALVFLPIQLTSIYKLIVYDL